MRKTLFIVLVGFLCLVSCNPPTYEYEHRFSTHQANMFECSLGKGDTLTAHIVASAQVGFYIVDNYRLLVYDAGSISDHRFTLKAPKTSTYYLCFQEIEGDTQVQLFYNSPTEIKDATIKTFG